MSDQDFNPGSVSGDPSSEDRAFTERSAPGLSDLGEAVDEGFSAGDVNLENPDAEVETPTEQAIHEAAERAGADVAATAAGEQAVLGDPALVDPLAVEELVDPLTTEGEPPRGLF